MGAGYTEGRPRVQSLVVVIDSATGDWRLEGARSGHKHKAQGHRAHGGRRGRGRGRGSVSANEVFISLKWPQVTDFHAVLKVKVQSRIQDPAPPRGQRPPAPCGV
jgi:hypothetical protein